MYVRVFNFNKSVIWGWNVITTRVQYIWFQYSLAEGLSWHVHLSDDFTIGMNFIFDMLLTSIDYAIDFAIDYDFDYDFAIDFAIWLCNDYDFAIDYDIASDYAIDLLLTKHFNNQVVLLYSSTM